MHISSIADILAFIKKLHDTKAKLEVIGLWIPEPYYQATLAWELPSQMAAEVAEIAQCKTFNEACRQILCNVHMKNEKVKLAAYKSKPKGDWQGKAKNDSHNHPDSKCKKKFTKGQKQKKPKSNHTEVHSVVAHIWWILDSSANKHIVYNCTVFTTLSEQDATITCANKLMVTTCGMGKAVITTNRVTLMLNEALYMPNLHDNLISAGWLINDFFMAGESS